MEWEVGKAHPYWNNIWDIQLKIEVWRPTVKIKSPCVHEIWFVPEDQVSVFFGFEMECVVSPSIEAYGDFPTD